ncbi:uncharacterized protein LOC105189535 isoform X2 [Harpegnathos saltator]|uniref:uncharacterized protein LOC105189535 isoform X2 n=1 Tax=Harpegnathos saltator TaxID=610380 RepID=UPI000948B741|nr:uncharacterized protein LOC105189535 isoform X2 [Harpegnathos saltator]
MCSYNSSSLRERLISTTSWRRSVRRGSVSRALILGRVPRLFGRAESFELATAIEMSHIHISLCQPLISMCEIETILVYGPGNAVLIRARAPEQDVLFMPSSRFSS